MKQYPYMNCRFGKIAFGVFLFAMLLLARDTLVTACILGFNASQFLMLGLICVVGMGFLAVHRRQWKEILTDPRILVLLAVTVVILLPMTVKRDWQMMYFSILLCLYLAVFLTYFISYRDAAKYYVLILTALGVYSVLATYFLRILPDRGILSVPVFFNSHDVKFHNFGLAFVSDDFVKNRNFGIFREPGVYQYFIILALFLNNYAVSWRKQSCLWTVNVLLSVTMLTTFATGGVAELGLLAVVVFFDKKLYRDKRFLWLAIGLVAAVILALVVIVIRKGELYWELYGMLVYKFSGDADSSSERITAILMDLDFFLRSPLVGRNISEVLHAVANNTASTMLMLALFGVFGGALHLASWVALAWQKNSSLWVNLALLALLLLSFNTQNLIADVFFWLFPVMALVERGLPKLIELKKKV
nr:hypothetical protein [Oscillospiraceae bacterium]